MLLAVMATLMTTACTQPWWGGGGPTTTTPGSPGGVAGVRHKRVTYPALRVPGMTGDNMSMVNTVVPVAEKPCTDCYIVGFRAGLVDSTGKQVNVREGYWLHHMVLFNSTPSSPGIACGFEGFFSSGNERISIDLTKSGNYGYAVRATDRWMLNEDLANLTMEAKSMSVTVDFDYVPQSTPGVRPARPLWLGASMCMGAYIPALPGKHSYSWTWTATLAAKVIYAHMHMHDGATDGTFALNGRVFCDSTQQYGTTPESIEGPGTMMPGMPHISAVHACQGTRENPVAQFGPGDRLTATANYDSNAHMLMGDEPLMGIGHIWLDASPV